MIELNPSEKMTLSILLWMLFDLMYCGLMEPYDDKDMC